MKVNVTFFKPSGKYYSDGVAIIPDEANLWDKGIVDTIMDAQDAIRCDAREFILSVSLPDDEQARLPNKHFIALLNVAGAFSRIDD
jgi:hypothetical protein